MATAQERVEHGSDCAASLCYPCSLERRRESSEAFCVNCKQYLCAPCVHHHRAVLLTRKHTLLTDSQMPTDMSIPSGRDMCSDLCPKHRDKILDHFCEDHDKFCCSACFIKDHRFCQNIVYVPEEADVLMDGPEFSHFRVSLADLLAQVKAGRDRTMANRKTVSFMKSRALAKIKTLRQRINTLLDNAESELFDKIQTLEISDMDTVEKLSAKLVEIDSDLIVLNAQIDKLQKGLETCQLYVCMKQNKAKLVTTQKILGTLNDAYKISEYIIKPDKTVIELLRSAKVFGEIHKIKSLPGLRAIPIVELQVKSPDDLNNRITSMVNIPGDRLVIADSSNCCLKLIDIISNTILSVHALPAAPWCVTEVKENLLAVTLPDTKQIQLLSLRDNTLTFEKKIPVSGKCYGLAHFDENFVVTLTDKPMIQVINASGKVLKTITSDRTGVCLDCPQHVVFSPDMEVFYITDIHTKLVTVLSADGGLCSFGEKATFASRPAGMSVAEDGSVFVCDNWSDRVLLLSPDGAESRQVIGPGAADFPESVLYCRKHRRLYVGMWNSDVIKVFQLEGSN